MRLPLSRLSQAIPNLIFLTTFGIGPFRQILRRKQTLAFRVNEANARRAWMHPAFLPRLSGGKNG